MFKLLNKIKSAISNPEYTFNFVKYGMNRNNIPDEKYLELMFKRKLDYELNLNNPRTFNEKIQWLKLNDKRSLYPKLVDKFKNREIIRKEIGNQYLVPLIGAWDRVEDIEWDLLPNQFVLKCNHDSGSVLICKDKNNFNVEEAIVKLNDWLSRNYFDYGREWVYKDIEPKIICEKYLEDETGKLRDYKIMCFNGVPKIIQTMSDREGKEFSINHFDTEWEELYIPRKTIKRNSEIVEKPKNLNEMLEISKILSENIPFVRVDLYEVGNKIYFGECTFYPVSGYMDFEDKKDDELFGDWLDLSGIKKLNV